MTALTDSAVLEHLAYNIFLPPKLPQEESDERFQQSVDLAIIDSVAGAIREFSEKSNLNSQWSRIELMLNRLRKYVGTPLAKDQLYKDMKSMKPQDFLTLFIRAQNAGLIIRKQVDYTMFEVFEVQPPTHDVMSVPGKLVRHFPGPVVRLPNSVASDSDFMDEVANILSRMNNDIFDEACPKTRKAGNEVDESRDSINPNYFIQFFFGFLRGMGTTIDLPRVTKRLADEVLWKNAKNPWRRSPIWLVVRVALQTSLDSKTDYKHFMAYHHAAVLSECSKRDSFSSDLLYAIRIKMARRLYKVKDTAPPFLIDAAKVSAEGTQDLLQGRWDAIQSTQAQSPNQDFSSVDFKSATNHTLPNSRSYLERVFQKRSSHSCPSSFTRNHAPRLEHIFDFSEYKEQSLTQAFGNDPQLALFDFEVSVFENLAGWTSKQRNYATACIHLSSCFHQYLTAAQSYYTADIADQSIMMLTLTRIWMAIDELAIRDCPLLREYSPELPANILDTLLLRTAQHVEQARTIQQYIHRRLVDASAVNPSIFSNGATERCFAVQYFRSSNRYDYEGIKRDIEQHAKTKKDEKLQELDELNDLYKRLTKEIQTMSHEYTYDNWRRRHSRWCGLCDKEKERRNLQIQPYEWPLPLNRLRAETVIFELKHPESFSIWRDITYEILVDFGSRSPRDECTQYTTLEEYDSLNPWLETPSSMPRITIASATKSFMRSHYSTTLTIPAERSQVCLNNALQFKLYDKSRDSWASGPFPNATFSHFGILKLPPDSLYRHLEYALEGTTHTSNQVLVDQYNCPKHLSLHEHIAFGTLRSGARLQWMNIVRGLEEDLLTFSSDEVLLLHTQAAWQIGPLSDDGARDWHRELSDSEFGCLLVSQCRRVLGRVKANWLQTNCVLTIVILVSRLLASLPTPYVTRAACRFMREAREVTFQWLNELLGKLQAATHEADIMDYQFRVCSLAAICRGTYDVDPTHIDSLLSTSDDIGTFIKCSIALYDNQPPKASVAPMSLQILLCRDRRLTHKIAPYILSSILWGDDALSDSLSRVWPSYRGTLEWEVLESPNDRWVTTTTSGTSGGRAQEVHLNILSGELLIDAKPLGRLPRKFVKHTSYIRLFGEKILDVVPAKSPGMEFATKRTIHGYEVSFALEESSGQLIVQARQENHLYELIPHDVLSKDFPLFFSKDYHHWADIESQTVEFRPVSNPWCTDQCQWLLRFNNYGSTTLEHPSSGLSLINVHSPAFKYLVDSIGPLESGRYMHATYTPEKCVAVDLPRMKLSFFLNDDNQLESRNFRGQILDENQSAGTLFGLKNQLLLRAKRTFARSLPQSRLVLIPDGDIEFTTYGHHVSISIKADSRRDVDVYRYKIDEDLGYLATDAGLTSRLFKIYLHALTSHCLPDSLTGRTGTEEALHELSQGSTSSFEQITLKQAELLKAIGLLTPKREYYPKHLQSMQTTYWLNLPSLSQHVAFSPAAAAVLRRADTLQMFHPLDFKLEGYISALETLDTLQKRTARQTAVYYPSDITGYYSQILRPTVMVDSVLPGRDRLDGEWEEAGQAASWASNLVYRNRGTPVFHPYDLVSLSQSWGTLDDPEKRRTLSYRRSWFRINLKSSWISFYNLLRQAKTSSNLYALAGCLASIAFGQTLPSDLIAVFLAFATNPEFQRLDPPSQRRFEFGDGYEPSRARVESLASAAAYSPQLSPASDLVQREGETYDALHLRRMDYYDSNLSKHQACFVSNLMNQWPSARQQPSVKLHTTDTNHSKWLNVDSCLKSTKEYFSSCIGNIKMRDHLQQLEKILSSRPSSVGRPFKHTRRSSVNPPVSRREFNHPWGDINFSNILRLRPAPEPADILLFSKFAVSRRIRKSTDTSRLANLFANIEQSESPLDRQYAADLERSRKELNAKQPSIPPPRRLSSTTLTDLMQTRKRCMGNVEKSFQQISSSLSAQTNIERVLFVAGIWPRITPRTILQQLSLKDRSHLNTLGDWRNELIGYAQVFADYQRSQRLAALAGSTEEFYKELDLVGSESDPGFDDPDWLLVQIDGNFGARSVQRRVAQEMISPSSESNVVLQLNMGEGKSSVIVPIIASSLADSSRLVRVVVLKPLWRQTFELLVNRLSGLANRRIYYLPFGRHVHLSTSTAHVLQNLYDECMREGGILVAQPEHILSFKLMGIERMIKSTDDATANNAFWKTQRWLNAHARDILDESDEILHVQYQLVYTSGAQRPFDNHPDRWTITQQLLQLASNHLERLQKEYPNHLLHKRGKGAGQFPTLRIMPDCPVQAERDLILAIAKDAQKGRLQNLSCDRLPPAAQNKLVQFFIDKDLPFSVYESLKGDCDSTMLKGLLLVRGLLGSGIIVFALKHKYYRVDYGLDPSRSMLADIPSLRSEFGHPDISIVLTCLSYYYQGLTDRQLDTCFELLFKLDNPALEYEQWVQRDDKTPGDLRQLNGVNIKDRQQFVERLVPTFSHNSATIDFFLSTVVFPREAKEFPEKLATSGWDLAERKQHVTTGFSGTNDNRYLLPTSISQADPVKQLSTNALVLTYLLQPENNHYMCMRDDRDGSLSTEGFLKLLVAQTPEIRVLLDVGAQMLELQNEELVRYWLNLRPDIKAAVYFNDRDELMVLPRDGTPAPLSTSPFVQRLDKCIVYLDDGHTRGTDLKLPRDTRALVTLGPKMTKDRLLQGCMRMRKLGHGQSVMFAAPPEIDAQIRDVFPPPVDSNASVGALDVLRWAMLETCKHLRHHVSHWAQQGIEYSQRHEAEKEHENTNDASVLKNAWTTPESRSLEQMYGVLSPEGSEKRGNFIQRASKLPELSQRLQHLGIEHLEDPSMDEEQEREVDHEVERQAETQPPPKEEPACHTIHGDLEHFILTGDLNTITKRSGVFRLFHALSASNSEILANSSDLLFASADFLQTIAGFPTDSPNDYMRPVSWILSGPGGIRVVLSPYEVNELLPSIRKSSVVRLHVYAPRTTLSMRSFSDLRFYTIPTSPTPYINIRRLSIAQLQLDLFAGQLYLSHYQHYVSLCASLGLFVPSGSTEDLFIKVESDGSVKSEHRGLLIRRDREYLNCVLTTSPIPVLKDLIGLRRKGMRYLPTHVGQILHGRSLTPEHFQKNVY